MSISYLAESVEYSAARDRLLEREIELRRLTEAVAAARRELPPGGAISEDYVFHGASADGTPTDVKLPGAVLFWRDRSCVGPCSVAFSSNTVSDGRGTIVTTRHPRGISTHGELFNEAS